MNNINETVAYLRAKVPYSPGIGLILGSGLGVLAEEIEDAITIPYCEIPYFPVSTVVGHAGKLVFGALTGKKVMVMQGRFHYYEGYSMKEVTYPIRVMQKLGIKTLLVTNAAGGINKNFKPGDLMIITDHINLMGTNPLIGPNNEEFGPRFPDMTEAYSRELIELAEKVAEIQRVPVVKGIYSGLTGPNYETPAEVRFLRAIGADATGMSTVPEVIAANHGGMRVLGISCITNLAAGMTEEKLSHSEVVEVGELVKEKFLKLVRGIIAEVTV